MCKVKFIANSANSKTGNISQLYLDRSTCPKRCKMKHICYARYGYCALAWNKCNMPIEELPSYVKNSNTSYLIRSHVAGDFSYKNTDNIDTYILGILEKSFVHHKVYCYTHCAINEYNKALAKKSPIIINFSCDSIDDIDTSVPCVLTVESMKSNKRRINGITFIKCPNSANKAITCKECMLCANKHRKSVIVFPSHGIMKNKLHNGINL